MFHKIKNYNKKNYAIPTHWHLSDSQTKGVKTQNWITWNHKKSNPRSWLNRGREKLTGGQPGMRMVRYQRSCVTWEPAHALHCSSYIGHDHQEGSNHFHPQQMIRSGHSPVGKAQNARMNSMPAKNHNSLSPILIQFTQPILGQMSSHINTYVHLINASYHRHLIWKLAL